MPEYKVEWTMHDCIVTKVDERYNDKSNQPKQLDIEDYIQEQLNKQLELDL